MIDGFIQRQVRLEPKEEIKGSWRQSRLILIWHLLGLAALAIVMVALFFVTISRASLIARVFFAVLIPLSFAVLIWMSLVFIDWYVRIFVLTNRRLIRREGIIRRNRLEVQLPKVQNASYSAEMVEKWLGLGRVKVETASTGPAMVINGVRGALGISQLILTTAEKAKQEIALGDEDKVRKLLSERLSQGL